VGYEVDRLLVEVRRELGLTHDWPCVIVGAGNLGSALAKFAEYANRSSVRWSPLVRVGVAMVSVQSSNVPVHHVQARVGDSTTVPTPSMFLPVSIREQLFDSRVVAL
jgi:NADH/NAD ratio-sensing transcriptional regulator Rex